MKRSLNTAGYQPGDIVLYKGHSYRRWEVAEIDSIGKMYATINDVRIHIPNIAARVKDPSQKDTLIALMKRIDEKKREADRVATFEQNEAYQAAFAAYCDRTVRDV